MVQRHSRLAGYGEHGKVWVNKHIPKTFRGIHMKSRVLKHEKVERQERLKHGLSYKKAHKIALKKEHQGLTRKQIAIYEGKLGQIARDHPAKRRKS